MIFSDEPRFSSKLVAHPTHNGISGVSKQATEAHVGPGAYISNQLENQRMGWVKPGFSRRQPMEGSSKEVSRSDHYISGVLSPNGTMSTPISPSRAKSPGPGYYEGPVSVFSFPTDPKRKQDLNLTTMSGANVSSMSTRNTTMTSSPRFAFSNSVCIKEGVLFQSATNDQSTVGPGYYSVPRNDFLKKSHNVRARGPENRVRSAQNTPVTTPVNSPFKRQPTTEVRPVYRPVSISAANSPLYARPGSATNSVNGSTNGSVSGMTGTRSRSSTPSSVQRPRSASSPRSGSTTPAGGSSLSSTHQQARLSRANSGASNHAAAQPSPLSRGPGLFSEHGALERVKSQQGLTRL